MPYLKDANHHDFGHWINEFRFAADMPPAKEASLLPREMASRKKLGIRDPLQGVTANTAECEYSSI